MNNNTYIHKYLKGLVKNNDICVDMTMGNGNDTYLLASLSKQVYSFDINKDALNNTRERCKEFNNIEYILDSHINVDKYVKKANLFIFNLGYLPNNNNPTTTKASDTLLAFKKAYELLDVNGYIIITFYRGHVGGKDEYYLLDKYIKDNNLNIIDIYQRHLDIDEPITYIIRKTSWWGLSSV